MSNSLPTGWRIVYADDIAAEGRSIVSGPFGSSIGKRFFVTEGVPVIRGNNLTLGEKRFIDDGFVFLTEEKAAEFKNCQALPGDIIFTAAGTLGQVGLIPSSPRFPVYIISNKQLRLRPNLKVASSVYLYYWFSSEKIRNHIIGLNTGASVPLITLGKLRSVPIHLPPLHSQHRIASILSAYDDLIENNIRRIKIFEEMAQTLYREWFVKFRFPGHHKVKMVDSPLGKIPEEWEVTTLNELCIRITDGSHSSPQSIAIGYPMASVKDMRDWALDEDSCRRIAESDYHILVRNDCKPLVNDVLIAKDGSYLKHAFVVEEEKELVILSSIAILRPNLEQILPHILCMYLRQPEVRNRLSGYVSGVALPRIVLKDFAKFLAVKPKMPLQTQFMMAVEPFVRLIHSLIKKNLILCQTRDLLLPKLISGELDVSELDITIPEATA